MKIALGCILIFAPAAYCGPEWAVVRIVSHGVSGTVIASEPSHTWILTSAHAFETHPEEPGVDNMHKRMRIDFPHPGGARPASPSQRIVALDWSTDLALVEVGAGPMAYVCPVAGPAYRYNGGRLISVGFDEMKLTMQGASAVATEEIVYHPELVNDHHGPLLYRNVTFTRKANFPGRSGGPLIDLDAGRVIGVVHGYEDRRPEFIRAMRLGGPAFADQVCADPRRDPRAGPGIFISHAAIRRFLERAGWR